MKTVIGIDVGGSTTKIVGFDAEKRLIEPLNVKAIDPVTSVYGAFGKFTNLNGIELPDIERVMVTGVGSAYILKPIYGLDCRHQPEFDCIGRGGLFLSGLEWAIIVSMGTGTALVYAEKGSKMEYLGGTGVGGGTLMGLSRRLFGMDNINHIVQLATDGDLGRVDLRISDITNKDILPGMPTDMTAANFGKLSDIASNSDVALGVINMVFETICMLSVFASRQKAVTDIVLTGNLTSIPQCRTIFEHLNNLFNVNFLIPDRAQYATVIGAALAE